MMGKTRRYHKDFHESFKNENEHETHFTKIKKDPNMDGKRYRLSRHAFHRLNERQIAFKWFLAILYKEKFAVYKIEKDETKSVVVYHERSGEYLVAPISKDKCVITVMFATHRSVELSAEIMKESFEKMVEIDK